MCEFPISYLSFFNGRKAIGRDLKFTKEFTQIADKNMPRYAKICQDKVKIKKGKKA